MTFCKQDTHPESLGRRRGVPLLIQRHARQLQARGQAHGQGGAGEALVVELQHLARLLELREHTLHLLDADERDLALQAALVLLLHLSRRRGRRRRDGGGDEGTAALLLQLRLPRLRREEDGLGVRDRDPGLGKGEDFAQEGGEHDEGVDAVFGGLAGRAAEHGGAAGGGVLVHVEDDGVVEGGQVGGRPGLGLRKVLVQVLQHLEHDDQAGAWHRLLLLLLLLLLLFVGGGSHAGGEDLLEFVVGGGGEAGGPQGGEAGGGGVRGRSRGSAELAEGSQRAYGYRVVGPKVVVLLPAAAALCGCFTSGEVCDGRRRVRRDVGLEDGVGRRGC